MFSGFGDSGDRNNRKERLGSAPSSAQVSFRKKEKYEVSDDLKAGNRIGESFRSPL